MVDEAFYWMKVRSFGIIRGLKIFIVKHFITHKGPSLELCLLLDCFSKTETKAKMKSLKCVKITADADTCIIFLVKCLLHLNRNFQDLKGIFHSRF